MVAIVTKRIKGHEYLYLAHSVRKGKRVIQKTVKYIGKNRRVPIHEYECMKLSYHNNDWILEEFKDELPYTDHEKLKKASDDSKKHLQSLDKISQKKERERFLSNFIANSNALEGSTLTKQETFNFLFKDISPASHGKKELFMATNLLKAWEYVEKHCKRLPTHDDLKKLHELTNRGIETDATLGMYKKVQNYIGDVHTSSFLFVDEKMEQLLKWIRKAYKQIDNFEVAFQSHAQFEIIHPFIDGNGRVGRLLLNWLLMYTGLMPLAVQQKDRNEYINALENTRKGKVEAISRFCMKAYLEQYKMV